MKIYLCFSGDYDDRYVKAVFSSREVAEQYSDDVEEFEVWEGDVLPQTATVFESKGVIGAHNPPAYWSNQGEWHVKRSSFQADEYYLKRHGGEEAISYWNCKAGTGIHVEVSGGNREEVDKRFAELQRGVEAGTIKPPTKEPTHG